ncbi:PREDICTED: uncharacterized protein LOC108694937 [Atta colombica]|uniref:uncharacterized protein LOC108694937 n=1 Tax=Atta colombica TaxID=520822 RepID=UPI00084BF9E2|nr:PREDICTED: uncharacterized protein LOC108694937 [Atta colombica]
MIAKAQIARIIITFGYGMMGAAIIVMLVLPLFGYSVRNLSNITEDLEKPFSLQTYYIYNTRRSPQYELTYAAQCIVLFFCTICYTCIDNFLSLSILESRHHLTFLNLAYFISIVTNIFGHMCMYCAVGEILTAKCDRIHYAVYFNEWYTLNTRNSRDLILLMLRTNKPLHLHFGKLFPLTMATFCSLLETSDNYM